MLLDPNIERVIREQIAPLIKRINKLETQVKELKKIPPVIKYINSNTLPN